MTRSAITAAKAKAFPVTLMGLLAFLLLLTLVAGDVLAQAGSVRLDNEPAQPAGPMEGQVPGGTLGGASQSDVWRDIRHGVEGEVSIPDSKAGVLVQSGGEFWQDFRDDELQRYSGWAMLATVVLLAAFFALRGRIRIDHGRAGVTVQRFKSVERFGHWLLAISFIILAITGLNILFGRDVLMPLIGKEAFALITLWGKLAHNYVAFAFMAGLILIFVMWVVHNLPSLTDFKWLAMGGGVLIKGVHPPAKKFNAGQKMIFWLVIIGGISLSLSGWALLFPFETFFFTETFNQLSAIGIDAPALLGLPDPPYQVVMEQQLNQVWHTIVAVFMICVILAHIYIGSVGMEGAYQAMGSGQVDRNWAKEHHSLWVEKLDAEGRSTNGGKRAAEPAE